MMRLTKMDDRSIYTNVHDIRRLIEGVGGTRVVFADGAEFAVRESAEEIARMIDEEDAGGVDADKRRRVVDGTAGQEPARRKNAG